MRDVSLTNRTHNSLFLDEDVDLGESSDEEVSDNEFSSKKTGTKKNRGFLFDFDNGEVCLCSVQLLQTSNLSDEMFDPDNLFNFTESR